MSKYIINDEIFKNKEEITERCREIIDRNKDKNKVGKKDLSFLLDLFNYHPNKEEKTKDLKRVYVDMDSYGTNICFWLENKKGFSDEISFYACIKHIPFSVDKKMDLKFPFGKYKGQSIYDVDDKQYLEWMYNAEFIDRGLKVKIGQFLRFGYIPFNPVAYNFDKKKTAARKKTTEVVTPKIETPQSEVQQVESPILEPTKIEPEKGKVKNYIGDFIKKVQKGINNL